jgi:hypothetical protein
LVTRPGPQFRRGSADAGEMERKDAKHAKDKRVILKT